jgi:hypothetical protein
LSDNLGIKLAEILRRNLVITVQSRAGNLDRISGETSQSRSENAKRSVNDVVPLGKVPQA